MPPKTAPIAAALRYSVAIVGPAASAAAQLLLSLLLLKMMEPAGFGRFSFLLVASQFAWGVWSALFCAPMPILLARSDGSERAELRRGLLAVSAMGALAAALLFFVIGLLLREGPAGALLFGLYSGVALVRWFARADAYAHGRPLRTAASDVVYSAVLLAGTGAMAMTGQATLTGAATALLVAAVAGLLPFGRAYLAAQMVWPSSAQLHAYRPIWREHSGWSLFGVVTTEATSNAHVYLVTLLMGAAAFAPIAASALVIRPIAVAMNALTEFERARMARQVEEGRRDLAIAALFTFRLALIVVWAGTAAVFAGLFLTNPHLVFPRHYSIGFLEAATLLWLVVVAVRMLRQPENALLQALGAFRPLAMASAWSSGISVTAVLVLLAAGGPLWSIAGVLVGDLVYAAFTFREVRRWRQDYGSHRVQDHAEVRPCRS